MVFIIIGDTMPDGKLKDGDGEEHAIQKSLGKQLTAIVYENLEDKVSHLLRFDAAINAVAHLHFLSRKNVHDIPLILRRRNGHFR